MDVIKGDLAGPVHHDGPKLCRGAAFSLGSFNHCKGSLFCSFPMLLTQVFNKVVPFLVGLRSTHVVVNNRICVAWDFFVDVREFEFSICDAKTVKCCVHATQPSVNVLGVERGKAGLLHLLLACSCGGDSGLDDAPVVCIRVPEDAFCCCPDCCRDDGFERLGFQAGGHVGELEGGRRSCSGCVDGRVG